MSISSAPGAVCVLLVLALSAGASAEPKDIPDRPPPLTFDKPVDYTVWYNDFVRRGRDEKDNAYPIYLKLYPDKQSRGGIRWPEGKAAEQFKKAIGRVWTPEEYPELAAYLRECEPSLRIFQNALQRRGCWIPAGTGTQNIRDIELCLTRSRLASQTMMRKAWMKQPAQAQALMETWSAILRHAALWQDGSEAFCVIMTLAARQMVFEQILAALEVGAVDGKELEAIRIVVSNDHEFRELHRTLLIDWASSLETLRVCRDKGGPDPKQWSNNADACKELGMTVEEAAVRAIDFTYDPREWIRDIDEFYSRAADIYSGPLNEVSHARLQELEKWRTQEAGGTPIRYSLLPCTMYYEWILQYRARRRGVLVALALHAHRDKHGSWPPSLQTIDAGIDKKILNDSIMDPYSNKSFVYRLKDGQPLLYSVETDGKDSGGIDDRTHGNQGGDYVIWARPKAPAPAFDFEDPTSQKSVADE